MTVHLGEKVLNEWRGRKSCLERIESYIQTASPNLSYRGLAYKSQTAYISLGLFFLKTKYLSVKQGRSLSVVFTRIAYKISGSCS
jgi:hypothetical protein